MFFQGINYWRQLVRDIAKKALLNDWDKFQIKGFGNAYDIKVVIKFSSLTNQVESSKMLKVIKKDKIALKKLG